jgi:hypothetical protein
LFGKGFVGAVPGKALQVLSGRGFLVGHTVAGTATAFHRFSFYPANAGTHDAYSIIPHLSTDHRAAQRSFMKQTNPVRLKTGRHGANRRLAPLFTAK